MEARRDSLLEELKEVWDEIGESETEREEALRLLEEECVNVYRAKVELVKQHRARLQKEIADSVAEVATICAAIGEPPAVVETVCASLGTGNLKEELSTIAPELQEMRRRREERRHQFVEVTDQIQKILQEINPSDQPCETIDTSDLSMRKLEERKAYLQHLQVDKDNRIKKMAEVLDSLYCSSLVLGMDFRDITLQGNERASDISDEALERVTSEIERLREIKRKRMEKLQDLVANMLELWNLMDTPSDEQKRFQSVACNIAASEHEITEPNALSMEFIDNVEAEVTRLEKLKASRMKDLVVKKNEELKEIRKRGHLAVQEDGEMASMLDSFDPEADWSLILERLEAWIAEAKEEEFSRKDVLERAEKWQAACEEESWLEEYNRNENRYNAGKGTHLTLKRAEKARALVSKMPAMVEALTGRVIAWEKERGFTFEYDGEKLLDMLEDYSNTRKEKEQERRKQRDQKKLQGQILAEQETLFGSKPPLKSLKKVTRTFSLGHPAKQPALGSSRPGTPSLMKSPQSARTNDEGQIISFV